MTLPDGSTRRFLHVQPETLRRLTAEAMDDISHDLRPAHLAQLRKIIDDPDASGNDRFVPLDLLKNVNISTRGVLPMCRLRCTAVVARESLRHSSSRTTPTSPKVRAERAIVGTTSRPVTC